MNISSGASILVSTKPEKERRDKRIQVSILGGTAIDSHPDAFLSLDTTDQPAARFERRPCGCGPRRP